MSTFDKHPCTSCGIGYRRCAEGWNAGAKCCVDHDHPTIREPNPWTAVELREMWSEPGRTMPAYIRERIHLMEGDEQAGFIGGPWDGRVEWIRAPHPETYRVPIVSSDFTAWVPEGTTTTTSIIAATYRLARSGLYRFERPR